MDTQGPSHAPPMRICVLHSPLAGHGVHIRDQEAVAEDRGDLADAEVRWAVVLAREGIAVLGPLEKHAAPDARVGDLRSSGKEGASTAEGEAEQVGQRMHCLLVAGLSDRRPRVAM